LVGILPVALSVNIATMRRRPVIFDCFAHSAKRFDATDGESHTVFTYRGFNATSKASLT
jgi:hypothetical protein